MKAKTKYQMIPVRRLEDIPDFRNEAEEHAFWSNHEFSDELADQAEPFEDGELPPPRAARAERSA